MEFCEKGDLQKLINKAKNENQQIPEDQIWKFIVQICLAIN